MVANGAPESNNTSRNDGDKGSLEGVDDTDLRKSDWSHASETINMLYLAVCQIETTMSDANQSVDTLTQSFTEIANHTTSVSQKVQDLHHVDELAEFKEDIRATAEEIHANIGRSVQAFQFYDRVCQRIDHVARSLEKVSTVLETSPSENSPHEWQSVQEKIKSSYTMEAERIMFEYIMRGGSVKDALEIYHHHFNTKTDGPEDTDEIELF